ncbi:MAG TPA: hypothetical protein VEX35_10910 [Allosphingosinicella sp.]|nr:hypothetical protein [Allosphingosinicella sp.]
MAIAGCVPSQVPPAPLPPPLPQAPAAPPLAPPPAPPPADWQTAPSYTPDPATPRATFRSVGTVSFEVSCERGRAVRLSWRGAQAPAFSIRTSFGERQLRVSEVHIAMIVVDLPPSDPLLEQIAFSRGRFLVQAEGAGALILPAWAELARVVEDCRGQ